jgi:hypothetical protein
MRGFLPLPADHPLVVDGTPCPFCRIPFAAGDEVVLLPGPPADDDERAKRDDGRAYTSIAAPAHARCES